MNSKSENNLHLTTFVSGMNFALNNYSLNTKKNGITNNYSFKMSEKDMRVFQIHKSFSDETHAQTVLH